jgi:hypothetical protein
MKVHTSEGIREATEKEKADIEAEAQKELQELANKLKPYLQ